MKTGSIYLITCPPNLAKLGFSTDTHRRKWTIFTTAPDEADNSRIRLEDEWPGTTTDESALHKKMRDHLREGFREWYIDSPEFRGSLKSSGYSPTRSSPADWTPVDVLIKRTFDDLKFMHAFVQRRARILEYLKGQRTGAQ